MRSDKAVGLSGLLVRRPGAWRAVGVVACLAIGAGGAEGAQTPSLVSPASPTTPPTPATLPSPGGGGSGGWSGSGAGGAAAPVPVKPVASPGLIESPFSSLSFAEAKIESVRRDRLLVVVNPTSRFYNEEAWMHPSVRAFVMWKAIVVKGTVQPSAQGEYNMASVDFYIGGQIVTNNFVKINARNPLTSGFFNTTQVRVGPLGLLLGMDLAVEAARTRDPLWGLRHDDKNPMPPLPDREAPMFDGSDGVAIAVSDLTRADGVRGVLKRLDEAREAVAAGDRDRAIGLYTWLMERSAQVEPSFDPARLFVVAPEFAALTVRYPGAMSRANALFERAQVRMPWAGPAEWFEMGATAECARRNAEVAMEMQAALGDQYEESALSLAAMTELKLITSRVGSTKDLLPTSEATVKDAEKGLKTSRPSKVRAEDWDQLQATRKWLIRAEGCRAYGALLAAGKEEDAARIAASVRAVHAGEGTRALIIMALAHGQAREGHRAWLDESKSSLNDALRAAVDERLK